MMINESFTTTLNLLWRLKEGIDHNPEVRLSYDYKGAMMFTCIWHSLREGDNPPPTFADIIDGEIYGSDSFNLEDYLITVANKAIKGWMV